MTGIIADNSYDLDLMVEGEGEGFYAADFSGYLEKIASIAGEKTKRYFKVLTKIGDDNQGAAIEDWALCYYGFDCEFLRSKTHHTTLSLDGDKRLRGSASADIKEWEVLYFIEEKNIDTLFISATLLSLKPCATEITKAVIREKDVLKSVVVDASCVWEILLLECVKESVEEMKREGVNLYFIGDALNIPGVRRMSEDRRDTILLEEKGEE